MITLKTPAQMAKMREAGLVVAAMLDACRASVRPGVTTAELDRAAAEILRKAGAASSFLGYGTPPYPATICTSVNNEIVHGIPSPKRKLREGDIVGIDAGAIVDGWHADAAITVAVGKVSAEAAKLIEATEEALRIGIASAKVGGRIGDIGAAVEEFVRGQGFSVVHNYVGHGIGRAMHEDPQVPNYLPTRGQPNPPISEGDRRPQPFGALRAHPGVHGRRAGRVDARRRGRRGGGLTTMIERNWPVLVHCYLPWADAAGEPVSGEDGE